MMKKIFLGACLYVTIASLVLCFAEPTVVMQEQFILYDERPQGTIKGYVPSGFMGDTLNIKYQYNNKDNPSAGQYCQRWSYLVTENDEKGWAGVYWQAPANNWGNVDGGFNLSKFSKLSFWARGEKGEEVIRFQVGGIRGEKYSDSAFVELAEVTLSKDWREYVINLEGADLSRIIGGFCWVATKDRNPEGCTFYLDDIKYAQ